MLLRRIKEFHRKTMEEYRMEEQEQMEYWKNKVMKLHEESSFLFYYDEFLLEGEKRDVLLLRGEHVKGSLPEKSVIYFYDGQGEYVGCALLLTNPEEKESQRKGFLTPRRNEFQAKLVQWRGRFYKEMSQTEYDQCLNDLQWRLSLISDLKLNT